MGSPLAKHVPVVLTALLVPQVVHILQLLVLLEPMPVAQLRVIHVEPDNTITNKDKLPNLVANHVVLGNTTIKQVKRPNQLLAKHVLLVLTVV